MADICDCSLGEWRQKSDWSFIDVWRRSSIASMAMLAASLELAEPHLAGRRTARLHRRWTSPSPATSWASSSSSASPESFQVHCDAAKDLRRAAEQDRLTLRRSERRPAHPTWPGERNRRDAGCSRAPSALSKPVAVRQGPTSGMHTSALQNTCILYFGNPQTEYTKRNTRVFLVYFVYFAEIHRIWA